MMKYRATRSTIPFNSRVELRAYDTETGMYGEPLTLADIPTAREVPPVMTLDATQAQRLMDDLWDCGLRPSEGSGSAGAMAATQRHLADMRALVASSMKVKLKENG